MNTRGRTTTSDERAPSYHMGSFFDDSGDMDVISDEPMPTDMHAIKEVTDDTCTDEWVEESVRTRKKRKRNPTGLRSEGTATARVKGRVGRPSNSKLDKLADMMNSMTLANEEQFRKVNESLRTIQTSVKSEIVKAVDNAFKAKLGELKEEMKATVETVVDDRMGVIEGDIRDLVKSEVEKVGGALVDAKQVVDSAQKVIAKSVTNETLLAFKSDLSDMTAKKIQESHDKLRQDLERKSNALIFNLDEPENVNAEDRKSEDKQRVAGLIQGADNRGCTYNIRTMFRLGNRDTGKKRPLLVVMGSEEQRESFIRNMSDAYSRTEKGREDGSGADLRLAFARDRSKEDRLKHKMLVEELKQREKDGEPNLGIRRGKVVTLPFPGQPRNGANQ